jgi:hypothetical protein
MPTHLTSSNICCRRRAFIISGWNPPQAGTSWRQDVGRGDLHPDGQELAALAGGAATASAAGTASGAWVSRKELAERAKEGGIGTKALDEALKAMDGKGIERERKRT